MRDCPAKLRGSSWRMFGTSQLFMLHGVLHVLTCAVGDRGYPVEVMRTPEYARPCLVDTRRLDSDGPFACPREDNATIFEATNGYVNAKHYQCLTTAGCDSRTRVCNCYVDTLAAYPDSCDGDMLEKYMDNKRDWQRQTCVDQSVPVCVTHEVEEDNSMMTMAILLGLGGAMILGVIGTVCFLQARYQGQDSDSDSDEDIEKKKKKRKGKGKGKGYAPFDDSGEKGKGKWYDGKGGSDGKGGFDGKAGPDSKGGFDGKGGWSAAPPPQHYGKGEDQGMQATYTVDGKGGDKGDGKGSKGYTPGGDGPPVDESSGSDGRKGFEGGKGKGRGKGRGKMPDPSPGGSPWAAAADPDAGWGAGPVQVTGKGSWSGARE